MNDNLLDQDMDRQKCIIKCYETIKNHHEKFKIKVDDSALANILHQIIDRFERDDK